ncbi:1-acyl-sn-glycerol-3-phosphate acyltransferase [Alteromonas sediminis]|uniref:1-acyl-sn-glycerol-3-phosphate acyltransferase n=1 Tax=Alteromonas sediminis TaxID=2259342 RepID=A0A3N5XZB5_9ALTE|nr:lysophospholipid acyltransferase family protein [Alteromonas sediminis]RPJ65406.1 1-acyl-sn-glycerol-3-phosphate acyltransferase [Alteromonas sediminis]
MTRIQPAKVAQVVAAAISYSLFGLGAIFLGLFARVISVIPGVRATTKQAWIRWHIHKGCLAFINVMRGFGLIRYTFKLDSLLKANPGHLIIANHPSLIDVVLLFAANKNLNCIVKAGMFSNVFTRALVRLAGFIPNNALDAVPLAAAKVNAGENVLIFPEGTRVDNDEKIRFKRGASNVAIAAEAPIIPVLIKCQPSALKKGDKWYNIPDGGPEFLLVSAPPLVLEECVDITKPRTLQYRELTRYLEHYYENWMANNTHTPPYKH